MTVVVIAFAWPPKWAVSLLIFAAVTPAALRAADRLAPAGHWKY